MSNERNKIDIRENTTRNDELMSAEHYAELYRLRQEIKGPDGYETWKDAAVAMKIENVKLRQQICILTNSEPTADTENQSSLCRFLPDSRIKYFVCGFLFDPTLTKVVLIRKNRGPVKMAGKLNGVGGKVNLNESKEEAQTREFLEETGVVIPQDKWLLIKTEVFAGEDPGIDANHVSFFAVVSEEYSNVKTITDEEVSVRDVMTLITDLSNEAEILTNLYSLIPLSIKLLLKPK